MSLGKNKKLVTDFFDCFGRKDVDSAMAMMTDDGTWWIGGDTKILSIAGLKTKSEMRVILDKFVPRTLDGLKIFPQIITAEDNRVAVEAVSEAKFPSGFIYKNQYHFLVAIRGEKIVSVKEYLDPYQTADLVSSEA